MRRFLVTFVVTASLALPLPTRASIVVALGLEELTAQAGRIAACQVLSQQARYDERRRIVTDVELRVEQIWKGGLRPGGSFVLTTLGGAIGDLGMRVEGEPTFQTGARYLVFAREARDGSWHAVGMSQGVLALEADASGEVIAIPNTSGLLRVPPRGSTAVAPSRVSLDRPISLATLAREIARLSGARSVR